MNRIKKYILFMILLIFGLFSCFVCFGFLMEGYTMRVDYNITNNQITNINSVSLMKGNPTKLLSNEEGDYILYLFNDKNSILEKVSLRETQLYIYYALNPEWFDENGTQVYFPKETKDKEITNFTDSIFVSYYTDISKLGIANKKNPDIILFTYDVSKFASPQAKNVTDSKKTPYFLWLIIVVLLAVVVIVVFKLKKKEHHKRKH